MKSNEEVGSRMEQTGSEIGGTWNQPGKLFSRAGLSAVLVLSCALAFGMHAPAEEPHSAGGVSFAVIGDSGTGKPQQFAIATAMASFKERDAFQFVVMLGDNIYGGIKGRHAFEERFEKPYSALLGQGVKFYAVLGNHGNIKAESNYEMFSMEGRRFYTFTRGDNLVQFFALDSSGMDAEQLAWLEKELAASRAKWKVALLHHPLYSSARKHGPNIKLRNVLEPLFVKYKLNVVLTGHEHVYERLKPQRGVYHFISGAAGDIRVGNIRRNDPNLAAGYDEGGSFMVFDVKGGSLQFRAINAKGEVVDSGCIAWNAGVK